MKRLTKGKKIAALLLTAIFAVSVFAACGKKAEEPANNPPPAQNNNAEQPAANTDNNSNAEQPAANTDANAAPADVPTVIWYNVGDAPANLDKWHEVTNAYLEEKIGIRVDYRPIPWGDWPTRHNTLISSGENYDILFTDLGIYNGFVSMGAFADMAPLLDSVAPELKSFIPEEVWGGVTVGGKIYALPTYKDCARTDFHVMDATYIDKYNIDPNSIKTLQDADKMFRTIKEGEGASYYPYQLTQATCGTDMFMDFYDGMGASLAVIGVRIDDASRTVKLLAEEPDVIEKFRFRHSWYQDGIINPDANVQTDQNTRRPYFLGVGWPSAASIWQLAEGVDKYYVSKFSGPVYSTESIQGALNSISVNSKNKEAAMKLLSFVNLDHKARDMFAYGIEGEDFNYVSENVVKPVDGTPFANMSRYSQATFFTMSTVDGGDPNQYNEILEQNKQATASVLLGFTMDITPVADKINACNAVWGDYSKSMNTGVLDPDTTLPTLIAELKAVGVDDVIAEAQRQIDEFYK